ncbi:MAG: type II secretion system GspH family protein [Heliobacteriaceae bacterium]|jgi:prepilin-type N-terminal cleavage/methylation domain-containing protein|nr:type II secretion system GspH family protein [Heliobacteriaceae bacterium]
MRKKVTCHCEPLGEAIQSGLPRSRFALPRNDRAGFTLAEVLITLGIIGVVAALTMPAIVQNYKRQVATSRIKKFVSTINQAFLSASAEKGDYEDWSLSGQNTYTGAYQFLTEYVTSYIEYFNITQSDSTSAVLKFLDGSTVKVHIGSCIDLSYDVNGDKLPNKYNRDIFNFMFCRRLSDCNNEHNFTALYCNPSHPADLSLRSKLFEDCKKYPDSINGYCVLLLQHDHWEFQKDYPYKL